jgi:hypothetical protein
MAETSKEIFETELPAQLAAKPDAVKDINAVLHFVITGEGGGEWTVDCTKASDFISAGLSGTPKMTITASNEDFVKIRKKELNPQMAAMSGKLKIKPLDMGLAMKLTKIL